ncbi:MAG: MerR family transcriptional regulator, partial [bacterium]|nr:MerR family transcriptional regulator [bacterium]
MWEKTYNLHEVAKEIGVSSAWINKLQKRANIVNKSKEGNHGKRLSFTKEELNTFKTVKVLRTLDFSISEIK